MKKIATITIALTALVFMGMNAGAQSTRQMEKRNSNAHQDQYGRGNAQQGQWNNDETYARNNDGYDRRGKDDEYNRGRGDEYKRGNDRDEKYYQRDRVNYGNRRDYRRSNECDRRERNHQSRERNKW